MKENKTQVRGELALIPLIFVNSFAVVLMLYSGSGISAISSVPYGFNQVIPMVSLGTWTYIFQGLLVALLFMLKKKNLFSLSFKLCGGIFLWDRRGSSPGLDRNTSPGAGLEDSVLLSQLSSDLFGHCSCEPVQDAHCAHRPFSKRICTDYRHALFQSEDYF